MLIFSSLRKGGKGGAFLPSLSKRRGEPVGRWMSAAPDGVLGNMTPFIQVYLCGLYLPNKYNNGGTAAEEGETGLWGGGEIRHPREQGSLGLALQTELWVVCSLLQMLANSWQGSLPGLRTKMGMEWAADTHRPGMHMRVMVHRAGCW